MPAPAHFVEGPPGALTGYRVIELAGPLGEWCGRLLANMGAEVIKVEPPGGAPTRAWGPYAEGSDHEQGQAAVEQSGVSVQDRSLYFWHNNTSKRGVTLDVGREEGRNLLLRLIVGADVFLETLPPGEAAGLGLDYAVLSA